MAILNIVADMHNTESLGKILKTYDNIVCLGDIGAGIKFSEFIKNVQRYRNAWKAILKKDDSSIPQSDREWFAKVNIDGWMKQMKSFAKYDKRFILSAGNAEPFIINSFPECRQELNKALKNSKLEYIESPEVRIVDKVQLLFLPFSDSEYDLKQVLGKISGAPLFVLGHCPPFRESRKKYYMWVFDALKQISGAYSGEFHYLHGHIHPSESYKYRVEGLEKAVILTPKSHEDHTGISLDHHLMQIDTETGALMLFDTVSKKHTDFKDLPEDFRGNEDHWNYTDPSKS